MEAHEELGPIDVVVIAYPAGAPMTGEAAPLLVDLVERGIIRILDLLFIKREEDGSVKGLAVTDLDHDGVLDLAIFEGASSGVLDEEDVNEAASLLKPGNSAGPPDTAPVVMGPLGSGRGRERAPPRSRRA